MPIPRTLHFIPFSDATAVGLSGATRSMLTLCTELARRGDVAVVPFLDGYVAEYARSHGIGSYPVFPGRDLPGSAAVRLPRTMLGIRRAARAFRPDLIHVHSAPGCKYAWPAAATLGLPMVSHQRDIYEPNRFHRGLGLAKRIVSISEWIHGTLPPRLAARSSVVHNAVILPEDVSVSAREPGEPLRIGFAGRFASIKGPDLLIDAAERLLPAHPDASFHFWGFPEGDGGNEYVVNARKTLDGLAARFPGRVEAKPFQKETEPFYRSMHVVVVPSRFAEPFGRVAIEGMAYGAAVVAAGHGGLPEIVVDQESGRLFIPDDAGSLGDCLESLITDETERRRLAANGLERVRELFAVERHADAILEIYRDLMGR